MRFVNKPQTKANDLKTLTHFYLICSDLTNTTGNGALTGTIPPEIAELTRLTYLSFGTCIDVLTPSWNAPLPSQLTDKILQHHETSGWVKIGTNYLTGRIPLSLRSLSMLTSLSLGKFLVDTETQYVATELILCLPWICLLNLVAILVTFSKQRSDWNNSKFVWEHAKSEIS